MPCKKTGCKDRKCCRGPEGPIGPTGPQGNIGPPGTSCVDVTYLGATGIKGDIVEIVPTTNENTDPVGVIGIDCTTDWLWVHQAGVTGTNSGNTISVDCNGNSYVSGLFTDTINFGTTTLTSTSNTGVFTAKSDSTGEWLWAQKADHNSTTTGLFNISGNTIDCDGNSYVTGSFPNGSATFGSFTLNTVNTDELFVAKLDQNGNNWLWATQTLGVTGSFIVGISITVDCDKNTYIIGAFRGTITFGSFTLISPATACFIAKLDQNGIWLWAYKVVSSTSIIGEGVVVDKDNNIYVTGVFTGIATFGPFTLTSSGLGDIFIAKLDTQGNWLWVNKAGGTGTDVGFDIVVDCDQNIYVTGIFRNTATFGTIVLTTPGQTAFVAKLTTQGVWLWATQIVGSGPNIGNSIAVDCRGNVYTTGSITNSATFGTITVILPPAAFRLYYAKLNTNGDWLNVLTADATIVFNRIDIGVDCNGNSYVTGNFVGNATFGPFTLTSNSSSDIYVAKIKNNDVGTIGFLGANTTQNQIVNVCFPGGVIIDDIYTNLIPGSNYYLDNKCQLTTCNKCAIRYLGVAITPTKLLTGTETYCTSSLC